MSKRLSVIVLITWMILAIPNCCKLTASNSKLKIEQIKILDYDILWENSKGWNHINYEKLGKDGLPVNLEITNGSDKIAFRFNKSENKEMKYRYKLIGLDTAWKNSNISNWVKFDKLKNGNYCFVLQEICKHKVTDEVRFKFRNKSTEFLIWNDFWAIFFSCIFILAIIKMK